MVGPPSKEAIAVERAFALDHYVRRGVALRAGLNGKDTLPGSRGAVGELQHAVDDEPAIRGDIQLRCDNERLCSERKI